MIACIAVYPHAIPVNIGLAHRPVALANQDEVHTAVWIVVIAKGFTLVMSKNILEYDWWITLFTLEVLPSRSLITLAKLVCVANQDHWQWTELFALGLNERCDFRGLFGAVAMLPV